MVLADIAGIAQTILANTTPQRGSEWALERPLPKDLVAKVEKSAPEFTAILIEDNGGQYIGGMNFGMAIAPATTVASRQSAKTFICAPVSLPTLPAPDKYPHV